MQKALAGTHPIEEKRRSRVVEVDARVGPAERLAALALIQA
jgi:hypothetical protein